MSQKYKCVVIDDEPIAIKVIVNYLGRISGFDVVATFTNALDALVTLREQQVDLIFLDIQMPGINGLEFYKTLQNPPSLIFTTAFRNFAADAFDVNAIDYLVKPIPFERFLKAINRFSDVRSTTVSISDHSDSNFIILKSDKKSYKVKISDILFIESMDDFVRVHTVNQKLICYLRLSALEQQLKSWPNIIRVHRSFIINTQHVAVFTSYNIEIGNKTIPIGRNYKENISAFLAK